MRGSDHVRESIAARDKYATAPMVNDLGGAHFTKNSPVTGTATTGISSVEKTIGGATTQSNSTASNAKATEASRTGYTKTLSSIAAMSFDDNQTALSSEMVSQSNGHQLSNAASNTIETARGMVKSLGVDDTKRDAATTIVGAGLRASAQASTPTGKTAAFQKMTEKLANIGVAGFGIGGDASGQVNSKHEEGRSTTASFKSDFMSRTGSKGTFTTSHSDAVNKDRRDGVSNAYTVAAKNNDQAAFSKLEDETNSKENSLSAQQAVTNTMGVNHSIPVAHIGAKFERGQVTQAAVENASDVITSSGLTQQANSQSRKFAADHPSAPGSQGSRSAGAVAAMTAAHVLDDAINNGHFRNRPDGVAEEQRAVSALNTLFSQATGNTSLQFSTPSSTQSDSITPKSSSEFNPSTTSPLKNNVANKVESAEALSETGGTFAIETMNASDDIKENVSAGNDQISQHQRDGNSQFLQKTSGNNTAIAGSTKAGFESLPAEGTNFAGMISDNMPNIVSGSKQAFAQITGGEAAVFTEVKDQFNDMNVQPGAAVLAGIVESGHVPANLQSETYNDLNKGYEAKQESYQLLGFGSRENGNHIEPTQQQQQTYNDFVDAVEDREWQTVDNIYTQSRGQDDISGRMNNLSQQMTK
jgi:hypothetical protein